MRREDKVHDQEDRKVLRQHKSLVEAERGGAGQHVQHPESAEEEKYQPMDHRPVAEDEDK